jgi:hypothetical protein
MAKRGLWGWKTLEGSYQFAQEKIFPHPEKGKMLNTKS